MGGFNLGLDHVHLIVKNLEEAIEFYEMIGLEFVEHTEHARKACMMRTPGGKILYEIQEAGTIENPGLNHMAFLIEDLDALCEKLEEKDVKVDGPVFVKATGRRLATIRDPHGFLWQLVQKK